MTTLLELINKNESDEEDLRVVFDHQIFLLQEYGGISRYICNLAKELSHFSGVEVNIAAPLHFNKNLDFKTACLKSESISILNFISFKNVCSFKNIISVNSFLKKYQFLIGLKNSF